MGNEEYHLLIQAAVDVVRKHPGNSMIWYNRMVGWPDVIFYIEEACRVGLIERRFIYPAGRPVRYYVKNNTQGV